MKFLAFSDIHNNIPSARTLYEKAKAGSFDAIVCAGDMGEYENARQIAQYFSHLKCPFLYVQGNWDAYPFSGSLGKNTLHLHLSPVEISGFFFLGYSGIISMPWMNPSTAHTTNYNEAREIRKKELDDVIARHKLPLNKSILVTHERIGNLWFRPLLHIFGHTHRHYDSVYKENRYVMKIR